ncbi:MAG: DUF1523 family protein [Planctomycetota bacterium]
MHLTYKTQQFVLIHYFGWSAAFLNFFPDMPSIKAVPNQDYRRVPRKTALFLPGHSVIPFHRLSVTVQLRSLPLMPEFLIVCSAPA